MTEPPIFVSYSPPDEFPTSLLTPVQKRNVDLILHVQQRNAAKD